MFALHASGLLALSAYVEVSLTLFQLVFSAAVSLMLFRLEAWQRRREGVEEQLRETTSRLVDERFRAVTNEVNSQVRTFLSTLEELRGRVASGDVEVRALGERDRHIELLLTGRVEQLKDWIRDYAAGKADVARYEGAFDRKLSQVELRLGELANTVAGLSERVRVVGADVR